MSGLEFAGLALAVFSAAIEVVEWYSSNIAGRETRLLCESLRNNQQIFLNSVESLLRCVVTSAELHILLNDFQGERWRDQSLNNRVNEHLGLQARYILESTEDIYRTISKLMSELPARYQITRDQSLLRRAKVIIKGFVHGKHDKASLALLRTRISEYRTLTEGTIKLAPLRRGPPKPSTDLQKLNLVKEYASGLYDALQAGWQCDCQQLHPANIELDVWSQQPLDDNDTVHLKFSFLFADDAQNAHSDHWMTAEIKPPMASPDEITPVWRPSREDISPKPIPVPLQRLSGASEPPQAASSGSSAIESTSTQDDADSQVLRIDDLCSILQNSGGRPRPVRRRLGSISDSNGRNFHLFSKSDDLNNSPARTSVKLPEAFRREPALSTKTRVQLALLLAWGVLQISSTGWLKGHWSKDNILLIMDSPNNPLPYVSHRFQSSRRDSQSSTLTPTVSNDMARWIPNASLFALGVVLLEVCYNRSIEDLAVAEEKNERGESSDMTPLLTTMRLRNGVKNELGMHYERAVNACFQLPNADVDPQGMPEDSSKFAKSMMRDIIQPLEAVAGFFG